MRVGYMLYWLRVYSTGGLAERVAFPGARDQQEGKLRAMKKWNEKVMSTRLLGIYRVGIGAAALLTLKMQGLGPRAADEEGGRDTANSAGPGERCFRWTAEDGPRA